MRPWVQSVRLKVRKWLNEPHSPLWRGALLFVVSTACALLLAGSRPSTPPLGAGDIAQRTVWAHRTYRILDKDLTETKRREALTTARAVYDFDAAAEEQMIARLTTAFEAARAMTKAGSPALAEAREALFAEKAAVPAGPWLSRLERSGFDAASERATISLLRGIAGRRIVARADLLAGDLEGGGISVRNVGGGGEILLRGAEAVIDLDAARARVADLAAAGGIETGPRRETVVALASHSLRPNLSFNASETEARRQRALAAVNEVNVVVQKGRAVVEAGHEVTEQQSRLLTAMRESDRDTAAGRPLVALGLFVLSAAVIGGVWSFGRRFMRRVPTGTRDLAVLASLLLLGLALTRATQSLSVDGAFLTPAALRFAVPYAATAIVAAVLLGAEGAALVAICGALLSGLALEADVRATIYLFLGSIAAAGMLALPQRRSDLLKAGFVAGLTQVALVGAFALHDADGPAAASSFWRLAAVALGSGVLSSILALGLLPVYEAFGYLTNFKLQELASLGSPLLKELSVQAPGTYHHSVVVGSLAEAAAAEIGANPLFARVACYYHDIGKMKKPHYFIENQAGGENLHDRLTPSMSALVVESHVKDGIEMGLAHGLPKAIVDVIPQHHGTRLISFFYNKAQKLREANPDGASEVVESDFRYPGPKPQTPEAGIIMLADGVEASTRSITDPTPERIQAMIHRVFSIVQGDGQLDECDLSLKDLSMIGAAFEKVVLAMHHKRVAYPATGDISNANIVVRMPVVGKQSKGD